MNKKKSLRTAFITISSENKTEKNGIVNYNLDDLKTLLKNWEKTLEIVYWLIEHNETDKRHFHIVIKFPTPYPFDQLRNKIPYGKIENAKSIKNVVQYLIHMNDLDKTQYDWKDVFTNCKDMRPYLIKPYATEQQELFCKIQDIKDGKIREYNLTNHIDVHLYSKYRGQIKNALEHFKSIQAMNSNRNIDVYLFHGGTGTGKTTTAKMCADDCNKSYCVSGSSNDPLQDYKGEEVLILDDLRADDFKFSDLLKILDNHTSSSMKSRYTNKIFLGDTIIITSIQNILNNNLENLGEDIRQLRRRIKQYFYFEKDLINEFIYLDEIDDYIPLSTVPNRVITMFENDHPNNYQNNKPKIDLSFINEI